MIVILRHDFKEGTIDRTYNQFRRTLGEKRYVADSLQRLWRVNLLRRTDDSRIDSLFTPFEGRKQLIPAYYKGLFTSAARPDRIIVRLCVLSGAIQVRDGPY